jgi:hypothetical protein
MATLVVALLWATRIAAIEPVGDASTVHWGKDRAAYTMKDAGVTLKVTGPDKVLLRWFTAADASDKTIDVEILRDNHFVSKNGLKLKSKGAAKGGPKGFVLAGALGFEVPAGEHTYKLTVAPDGELLVAVEAVPTIAKPQLAARETELPQAATTNASAAATPPGPAPVATMAAGPAPAPVAPASPPAKTTKSSEQTDVEAMAAMAHATAVGDSLGLTTTVAKPEEGAVTGLAHARRVAVYDLKMQGVEPTIGSVVTDSLLGELRKLRGVSAIGLDEVREMLAFESAKDQLGCDDVTCLAEIGGALGADDLITGSLSKVGEGHVMTIRRVDQRQAKVAGTYNQRLEAGKGDEFLLSVGPAIEQLFPEQPLRPGAKRGVPEEVALRLHPPPLPTWSVYSVGGGALAALAAGGAFALLTRSSQSSYNDYAALGKTQEIQGSRLKQLGNDVTNNAFRANALFITGGALALSAGIMSLFTDWHGYRQPQSATP